MPPRRRTFYLADATVLSNSKVRRLSRQHPDDWLAAWGAFHILIGVATLNGSPRLSDDDVTDILTPDHSRLADVLRDVGLLTSTGIDPATYREWCPKPRPKYPSDSGGVKRDSGGVPPDSGGVGSDSGGVETDSGGIPAESPTSTTASSSSTGSTAASTPSSRGVGGSAKKDDDGPKAMRDDPNWKALSDLSNEFVAGKIDELTYARKRNEINGKVAV